MKQFNPWLITSAILVIIIVIAGIAVKQKSTSSTSPSPVVENQNPGRTIMLHSSNWEFQPSTITVKKGENVSLHLMGIQGNHGLSIPALGINETMSQGQNKLVKIPTDTAGAYEFSCSVPCGSGHRDMKGTLVIE